MIREKIEQAVREALQALGAGEANFVVERPTSFDHGDYATNAALAAGKLLKKNPKEVAESLRKELEGKIGGVEKTEVAGAGFVNFFLSREQILKEVQAAARDAGWGKNDLHKGKKIMVEYTDPNPFKEFHIGHLMSNAIGEAIARTLEASGAQVVRANYQGDVGLHVAKAIWGKIQKPEASWGAAYVYGSAGYEGNKAEIDEINKKIYEKSDERVNKLYTEGREFSLKHFEDLYRMLGTAFDIYFFESETWAKGLAIVKAHPDIFEESEGAVIFRGTHTRVFVNSQGLPTYEAKELGLAEMKREQKADEYVYVTASEQNGFFEVVFEAVQKIFPDLAGKLLHRSHGMMRFAEGKMSSRKGNVITGESLLADLKEAAKEKMRERDLPDTEKIAEQVAVGAVKYAVLKQGSGKDIIFDQEKSLSIEGDSGPYVQYAHTRALSLLREAGKAGLSAEISDVPTTPLPLERLLVHFSDALARAAREFEPHFVTTYATELAAAFNSWYASERVIGGTYPHYGLLLVQAVEKTLAESLAVLGIPAPEKM